MIQNKWVMLEPGERISATVDRISNSGNGIVELDGAEERNIGPIKPNAVGEEVDIEILSGEFDRCLTTSIVSNDYNGMIALRSSESAVPITVDRVTESGFAIVELDNEYLNVGPISCSSEETIDLELLQKGYAECTSEGVLGEGYGDWLKLITEERDRLVLPIIISERNEEGDSLSSIGDFCINTGPLDCEPGDLVDAEILKSPVRMNYTLGYCLNREHRRSGYEERMQTLLREFIFKILGVAGSDNVVEGTINRISSDYKSSDGVVEYHGREYNIGPIREEAVGETVEIITLGNNRAACLNKDAWGTDQFGRSNIAWIIRQVEGAAHTSDEVESVLGFVGARKQPFDTDRNPVPEEDREAFETSSSTSTVEDVTQRSRPWSDIRSVNLAKKSSDELARLRARAEQAASDNTVKDVETSPGSQYVRSSEIKKYAKTRADGFCEGCGKQSPFISKQGEPYLEVHHVNELGEGGSDSPDSVIALCPACHSRIHYGEDGEKYNQELRERVENKLADIGR